MLRLSVPTSRVGVLSPLSHFGGARGNVRSALVLKRKNVSVAQQPQVKSQRRAEATMSNQHRAERSREEEGEAEQ